MKFTGFMEATGFEYSEELLTTTIVPVEIDDLFERMKRKLLELPPGTSVRIDLISRNHEIARGFESLAREHGLQTGVPIRFARFDLTAWGDE